MCSFHAPVLVNEVLDSLCLRPGGTYVDGTIGGGGHAYAILEKTGPDGLLVGMDRDDDALTEAGAHLKAFGNRVTLVKGNFAEMGSILAGLDIDKVDGILLDLGVSSHQLDKPERGFSFSQDAPLDMRMDRSSGVNARALINMCPEEELAGIIREFGEERMAGRIARTIVEKRKRTPIETTAELASVVAHAVSPYRTDFRIHPATRTFQALRIAVNGELENLRRGLKDCPDKLKAGGRLSIIAFHSLEDRIVKETFAWEAKRCTCPPHLPVCLCGKQARMKVITRKPVRPGAKEVASNPRSRSARLRTAERI